ncbi:MAG: hypothetical protein H6719_33965 [Sandaracinaceae bacterium]|nr:hypothetical protein [Sandaracinaceae bacterium]
MRERVSLAALVVLLGGCADPCADLGPPTLTLGTTNAEATTFDLFDDGGELPLSTGPQIGMHVWLNLRVAGFCPPEIEVDRRVVDDETEALIEIQRGPLDFVEDTEPGTWVLDRPLTMIICPTDRAIIGEHLRFAVRAEDSRGRVDIAMKPFVPVCVSGTCELCVPP